MKTPAPAATPSSGSLISKLGGHLYGVLEGFDRLRLRGTLPKLYQPSVMEAYLCQQHVRLQHFGAYVEKVSASVRAATAAFAESWRRPVQFVASSQRSKEELAREIAARDGITEGLICVLTATEPCQGYRYHKNPQTGCPELCRELRKCRHDYFYFEHPQLGFLHVRLQTWFPFEIKVCLNGRHWLARQLTREGIAYRQRENAILWVEDVARAQALLDEQVRWPWAQTLEELKDLVHPTAARITAPFGLKYVWTASESEYASDLLFKDPAELARRYPALVQHALSSFDSGDVMRFLGRSVTTDGHVHGHFQGEIISDLKRRPEGLRVKHSVDGNSVKMYDKQGSVLRVETTINHTDKFLVRRAPTNHPSGKYQWLPLRRSVDDLPRRAEASAHSNRRYLEALGSASGEAPLAEWARAVCEPVRRRGKRARALNPFGPADAALLAAASRGEFAINGFRNADLRALLYPAHPISKQVARRQSAATRRRILLLRHHGLVHKVGRSRRYVVTPKGREIMTAFLTARRASVTELTKLAA